MSNPTSNAPWVSVGMPVYNSAEFIRKALDSILGQTHRNFELIISDNASTDDTESICRAYSAKDPRIRYVRQSENIGATSNFRYVLEAASHDRFIWATADDWWDPDRLERLISAQTPEDASVLGRINRYVEGQCYASYVPVSFRKGQWWKYLMREESRCEKVYFIYGLMWRNTALNCFGGIRDRQYWADAIFCYRLLWQGNLKSIEDATLHCVSHPSSTGAQWGLKYRWSWARLLFRAHPYGFYRQYIASSPSAMRRRVAMATIVKAIASQFHIWWRAFRRIVLRRPYVHGALPGGERLVYRSSL